MVRGNSPAGKPFVSPADRRAMALRRYVEVAAIVLSVVPLAVLIGWQFNVTVLKSVLPGFASMNPVVAACFIVLGIAILLRLRGSIWRIAGSVLVAPIGIAGAFRLYCYATHQKCFFDSLIFASRIATDGARMTSAEAGAFLLAAASIVFLGYRTKNKHCPSLVAAVAVGSIGLFITNRYAFHIFAPDKGGHVLTSFFTGMLLVVLSTGLSVYHTDTGVMAVVANEMPGSKIVKRLLLASFAVPYIAGIVASQNHNLKLYGFSLGEALYSTSVTGTFFLLVVIGAYTLNHVDSKRKDAEENIVLQRHFLQTIVDSVPNFIFVKAISGSYKFANKACAEALGVTPEELIGTFDIQHRRDRSEVGNSIEEDRETIVSGTDRFIAEEKFTDSEGKIRWLQTVKRPIPSVDRRTTDLLGVCTDITNRKQITQELEETQEKLDGILASIEDVVWSTSVDGKRLLYVNPAIKLVYGHEATKFYENPALRLEMIHEEDATRVKDAFANILQTGTFEAEYRIVRADGNVRWILDHATVVSDSRGRPRRLDGLARDVTESKIAAQLQADLLRETERANLAKSEFLSRMSHELRTPLNSILGFAQVLQLQPLNEVQRRSTDHILKGGQHLLGLINEVLDIARIETGHLSLSCEPVSIRLVVDQAMNMITPLAANRKVSLVLDEQNSDVMHVRADRQRFVQVMINLLSNAVKYNREGGTVRISWTQTASGVEIRVADTGGGVPSDKLHRLFAPFDRLEAEDHGFSEGTGLGLALSKSLVELMAGTLELEKTGATGSTFLIKLPNGEVASLNADQDFESVELPIAAESERQTVLYIEDNPANVTLVEELFSMLPQYKLLIAMQGRLGLEIAKQHQPAIVLLDVHLPDCSGSWVLEQLKADPKLANIPVVMLSADATEVQIQRLMQGGACAYLTKPLNVTDFFKVIRDLKQERRVA